LTLVRWADLPMDRTVQIHCINSINLPKFILGRLLNILEVLHRLEIKQFIMYK